MKQYFLLLIIAFLFLNKANSQDTLPRWKTLPSVQPMPKSDDSGMAAINGAQLYYAVFNKNGKDPVLLLHGGFTSCNDWGNEVTRLYKTHKVIVTDTRGHGRSTMSAHHLPTIFLPPMHCYCLIRCTCRKWRLLAGAMVA